MRQVERFGAVQVETVKQLLFTSKQSIWTTARNAYGSRTVWSPIGLVGHCVCVIALIQAQVLSLSFNQGGILFGKSFQEAEGQQVVQILAGERLEI